MSNENSYDNQFNDGCFNLSIHISKASPTTTSLPSSLTSTRGMTEYPAQGIQDNHDTTHLEYVLGSNAQIKETFHHKKSQKK